MKKILIAILLFLLMPIIFFTGCNNVNVVNEEYVGVFLDYDVKEPNLIIEKNDSDDYTIKIGIFRLIDLEDNNAKLTKEGIVFNSIDPAGEPISGLIIVKGDDAIVRFTSSTWYYIDNGEEYKYRRKKFDS